MRKSLLTLSLALMLGGAAVAVAATTTQNKTADTQLPVQLAQAEPFQQLPPARQLPRQPRAPLSADEIARRQQARCEDRADRMAGQLAYLEARLDLNDAQQASFVRWRDTRLAAAQRQVRTCVTQVAGRGAANDARPSPVERMTREEERLRSRLADLTAERPALEALYNSLSPEQRQKFTPAGFGGMGRGGMRPRMAMAMRGNRGGMMRGPNARGLSGRGPGGRGPDRGMGPGMTPPPGGPAAPPPAQ